MPILQHPLRRACTPLCKVDAGCGWIESRFWIPDFTLALRRSTDDGKTWGAVIEVQRDHGRPCPTCPTSISNANPVEVSLRSGTKAILLHFDTMNNPGRGDRHGLDMQTWSYDDGLTWSTPTMLQYPPQINRGAMIGPSVGIQSPITGRIYFSAHLAYSYYRLGRSGTSGDSAFLYWSDDDGHSWSASESVYGLNECSIAFRELPRRGREPERVLMNCRVQGGQNRAQVVFADGEPQLIDGKITRGVPGLLDPGCQGSIINHNGVLYLSSIRGPTWRQTMVVKCSRDQGRSWSEGVVVYPGAAAYSQLVGLGPTSLGLLYETETQSASLYGAINFVHVSTDTCPLWPPAAPSPPLPSPSPPLLGSSQLLVSSTPAALSSRLGPLGVFGAIVTSALVIRNLLAGPIRQPLSASTPHHSMVEKQLC
jgi:sialidase-1